MDARSSLRPALGNPELACGRLPCEDLWAHTPRTVSGGVRGDARHDLKVRVGATGAAASALQDGGDGSASREHGIKGAERDARVAPCGEGSKK